MIKRISLLITAALLVATMAMAGLAGPAFADSRKTQELNAGQTAIVDPGNFNKGHLDDLTRTTGKSGQIKPLSNGLLKKVDLVGNSG